MSVLQNLIEYVTEQKTTRESIDRIHNFCKQQPPVSLVLYRGHKRSTEIRHNRFWYSSTSSKKVAKEEFSSGHCCVFKIHLVNVPVIDVNKYVGDKIGDYKEEKEYIFLGGGTFYKDANLKKKGFLDLGKGKFECWYKIDTTPQFDLERTFSCIPSEEYEFIDSPSDIHVDGLTNAQKVLVFQKINEIKQQSAGDSIKSNKQSKTKYRRQSRRQIRRQSRRQSRSINNQKRK